MCYESETLQVLWLVDPFVSDCDPGLGLSHMRSYIIQDLQKHSYYSQPQYTHTLPQACYIHFTLLVNMTGRQAIRENEKNSLQNQNESEQVEVDLPRKANFFTGIPTDTDGDAMRDKENEATYPISSLLMGTQENIFFPTNISFSKEVTKEK